MIDVGDDACGAGGDVFICCRQRARVSTGEGCTILWQGVRGADVVNVHKELSCHWCIRELGFLTVLDSHLPVWTVIHESDTGS